MRFRVTYTRRQDLQRDLDTQLARHHFDVLQAEIAELRAVLSR